MASFWRRSCFIFFASGRAVVSPAVVVVAVAVAGAASSWADLVPIMRGVAEVGGLSGSWSLWCDATASSC